jgi:type VI secretion system protein ImpA
VGKPIACQDFGPPGWIAAAVGGGRLAVAGVGKAVSQQNAIIINVAYHSLEAAFAQPPAEKNPDLTMPSPAVLDLDSLLAPISTELPTGPSLRGGDSALNDLFYQVSDARKDARTSEQRLTEYEMAPRGNDPTPPPKLADWSKVVEVGSHILATKSKDLWITAWMIEGLCRTDGFAGLRDGFRLARELCQKYWDTIHPRSETDPEDVSTTVKQLSGVFDGVLNTPIYNIPITGSCPRSDSDRTPRYSLSQQRRAAQLEKSIDPKQKKPQQSSDKNALTMDEFNRAVEATTADFFRNRLDDLDACLVEFNSLASELDGRCGAHAAPPSTKVRETLQDYRNRLVSIAGSKLAAEPSEATPSKEAADAPGKTAGIAVDGFASRDQALQTLLKVAEYFRKHEPHSIVPYSLEQVVRWGRMSLPDLLTELISDTKVRKDMFRHTGIAGISGKADDNQSE